jgi:hypothetical protein
LKLSGILEESNNSEGMPFLLYIVKLQANITVEGFENQVLSKETEVQVNHKN